jgi:hypothetical protein
MIRKLIDLLFLTAFLVGGVLAWQSGRERIRLRNEHARLARKIGDITISDSSKVYIQAIDTGEPLNFAWRVYFPANYKQMLRGSNGGTSTSTGGSSCEFVARVRIRENEQGGLEIFTSFKEGSSWSSFGDKGLADFLRNRLDRIHVEQLGALEIAVLRPDQKAVLLSLSLPDDFVREAGDKLSDDFKKRYVPILFELNLGDPAWKP